jgi:hypothetical protein
MTLRERLDGYLRCGLDVYLNGRDELKVRAARGTPPAVRDRLIDAALPALRHHKAEIIECLKAERTAAVERLIARHAPSR